MTIDCATFKFGITVNPVEKGIFSQEEGTCKSGTSLVNKIEFDKLNRGELHYPL